MVPARTAPGLGVARGESTGELGRGHRVRTLTPHAVRIADEPSRRRVVHSVGGGVGLRLLEGTDGLGPVAPGEVREDREGVEELGGASPRCPVDRARPGRRPHRLPNRRGAREKSRAKLGRDRLDLVRDARLQPAPADHRDLQAPRAHVLGEASRDPGHGDRAVDGVADDLPGPGAVGLLDLLEDLRHAAPAVGGIQDGVDRLEVRAGSRLHERSLDLVQEEHRERATCTHPHEVRTRGLRGARSLVPGR